MAQLAQKQTTGGHWYDLEGKAVFEVPKADGKGLKKTTIKEAREMGLLPSVTGILDVLPKKQLETWKMRQVALHAHLVKRGENEEDQSYADRVIDVAMNQVSEAKDLGSAVHKCLEQALSGETWDQKYDVYVNPVLEWLASKNIRVRALEKILVNPAHGYAGTSDVLFEYGEGGIGVLDFKSRKTNGEAPGKILPYDGQGMQLAAYAAAEYGEEALPRVLGVNLYISTTEPGRFDVYQHESMPAQWEGFQAACALWRFLRGWDPRQYVVGIRRTGRSEQLEALAAEGDEAAAAELGAA